MLRPNRRDWFSVVATDLFCGLLSAVIIFDAVSPKEESSSGTLSAMRVSYEAPQTYHCGTEYSVVISFLDGAGNRRSSFDARDSVEETGGECVEHLLFQDMPDDGRISDPSAFVAEYGSEDPRNSTRKTLPLNIRITSVSGQSYVCNPVSNACL